MALAPILGIFLLLSWPGTRVASLPEIAMVPSTHAQESQASNSSHQCAAPPATDQQKTPDQAPTPTQSSAPPNPRCRDSVQSGSNGESDCNPAAPTGGKTKKQDDKAATSATAPTLKAPPKRVVNNGGADNPTVDLSGLSPQQASHQKESTKQLLATINANLKKVAGRKLSPGQQDMLKQIDSYMKQVVAAEKAGDMQHAHSLAVKANLLSADLVGPEK